MADTGMIDAETTAHVASVAGAARTASRQLALLPRSTKDAVLRAMADDLEAATAGILAANEQDIERGRRSGLAEAMVDRLRLDAGRVHAVADALRDIAGLPDPVGEVVRGSTLANGLQIRQVRVPMGVVGMIYEARPNVTVDAAGLALKSGNAVVLRGGSAAGASNRALVDVLRGTLEAHGLPAAAVTLLDEGGRDAVRALMRARGLVDVLIPRGGADLIRTVVEQSTVPVIETGVGNCHVYVDAAADPEMALRIAVNSKTHRVSVCNSAESLLVHRGIADDVLPKILTALAAAGVTVHGDAELRPRAEAAGAAFSVADDDDFAAEYLSLDISVRVVDSLDAGARARPALRHRPHRGHRHPGPRRRPAVDRRGRRGRGDGQRVHPLHRRRRVRLRRRDRHLDPEAARPRPDGAARADHDQVGRRGGRPDPRVTTRAGRPADIGRARTGTAVRCRAGAAGRMTDRGRH